MTRYGREGKADEPQLHLEEAGLESGESHTHFEVQLLAGINRQSFIPVRLP